MHLMQYVNEKGERVYTLKVSALARSVCAVRAVTLVSLSTAEVGPKRQADRIGPPRSGLGSRSSSSLIAPLCIYCDCLVDISHFTPSAARFSPDDKFSRERITLKKRFGLLPTQTPHPQHTFL